MIKITELLKAYETIQRAKIEQEITQENKKIQKAINEHYTCYNRCYYLKYSPEDYELIKKTIKNTINGKKWVSRSLRIQWDNEEKNKIKKETKQLEKILIKLEKNAIYWKLENKI